MDYLTNLPFNPKPSTIMHIDLNSCFATIEQQANPLLRGRPIAVAAYIAPSGCILAPSLVAKSNLIAKLLDKKHSLFTLDFIISNNGNAYFLEGNTGPGLDWNVSIKKNVFEGKKLIRLIVEELFARVQTNQVYLPFPVPPIPLPSYA